MSLGHAETRPPAHGDATSPQPPSRELADAERSAVTARLLDQISRTDDERERELLRGEVVVLNMGVA
ncbi:MAG: hypothetical protein ACTHOK_02850, partial [Nocardioidaceae bacterium]